MPLNYSQLFVNDFNGGITDNYINAEVNQYKSADNFIIHDGELRLRFGNRVIYNASSTQRIMGIIKMNEEAFFGKGDSVFRFHDANYSQAHTYASLQASIVTGASIRDAKNAEWTLTKLLSGEKQGVKIVTDHLSLQIDPADAAALDNSILYRLEGYERFNNQTIINPPNGTFFSVADDTSYMASAEWRDQLHITNSGTTSPVVYNDPMRLWKESESPDVYKAVRLGLPAFFVNPPFTEMTAPIVSGTALSYIYTMIFEYEYFVGDIKFKNVSAVHIETVQLATAIDTGNGVQIGNFPDLTGVPRLDTTNIKIGIYRSQAAETGAGTVSRKIGEVSNGFAGVFLDEVKDEDYTSTGFDELGSPIDDAGILLYTNGGLLEHFPAPKCKYLMVVNDICYYMNVIEELNSGDEIRPYRFVQSIPNAPSAVDLLSFEDLDDVIVGGNHINGLPIIFTKSFIYRIEGQINADGTGNVRKRVISDTVGCLSHKSIIRTNHGLFFAGNNGIYITDGYQVTSLTAPELDDSYAELVSTVNKSNRITGTYDEKNELVYFGFSEIESENDVCWIYNINKRGFTKIRGIRMLFTSLMFFKKYVMRGDELGYIYEFNEGDSSDVRRDNSNPYATDWQKERIDFKYETVSIDGGNPHVRKWGNEFTVSLTSDIPSAMGLSSNNDDGKRVKPMKEIRLSGSWIWGDENFIWNDTDFEWRVSETTVKQRRFPKGSARFRRKQISIEPTQVNLYRSDIFDQAEVLDNPLDAQEYYVDLPADRGWPIHILNDSITFDVIDYTSPNVIINKRILRRESDQRIVIESGGVIGGAGKNWVISGYRRDQRFAIRGISVTFAQLDNVGGEYKISESGENA